MKYLVDTDWIAAYLKGRQPFLQVLTELATEGLAVSLMTYGEIYEGIYFGTDPKAQETGFQRLLRVVAVLPFNRTIMRRFARLRGQLRQTGQLIGDPDVLIAATALQYDLTLITNNRRHFERIAELKLLPTLQAD